MVAFPTPRNVALPGRDITLSVHEMGEGPAVVFSHGFPELAFSWRHQLPAVATAGFRAIAPDQRGYGGSTAPRAIDAYGLTELTGDLVALLDALEIEKAVFVGHDWGGFVVWGMPVLHPERTAGVVGVCTPYVAMPPTDTMRLAVGGEDERLYILWFQEEGVAEGVMDPQIRKLFTGMMRAPLPPEQVAARVMGADGKLDMNPFRKLDELTAETDLIVTPQELETYVETFEKTGLRGGVNWYRNIDRNAREHPEVGQQKLELPCLMLTAEWDAALRPELAEGMPALCSDLEVHCIPKAGHWVQQEAPDIVNRHLVDWLTRRFR